MTPDADPIELSVGVFVILRDVIRERIGVNFEENNRDLLAAKLAPRVHALGLRSFLDYYYLLKYDPAADAEWPNLTDALSVQETYFWREFDQVRTLVRTLLPRHVADGRGPVRIWSAACATGEEPLTIAMALAEAGWFDRAAVEIWASDISTVALEKARAGLYRERAFRALPPELRRKYFTSHGAEWKAAPELLDRVRFVHANLSEPSSTAALAGATYVFCRNVFIYFSPATIGRVVGHFARRMPRPGYLFLGAAESLMRIPTTFQLEEIDGAFVYVNC